MRHHSLGDFPNPHIIEMVDGSDIEIDLKDIYKNPTKNQKNTFESLDLETFRYDIQSYIYDDFGFDVLDPTNDENGEEFDDYKMKSMIEMFEKKIINYVKYELRKVK